jgi:spore maturation protein SpmA
MLNWIWLGLLLAAVLTGALAGTMPQVTEGAVKSAESAVTLAIGMVGIMSLWLGMMRLAEQAGWVAALARVLRPLLRRLFPDVPPDHPAMGSILMNMAANMLGLNNAATPLGIRAMQHLERLNPRPGTATNAMCTFLAINTSSIQLVPATTVAILAGAGAVAPTAIIGTAFLATCCSTAVGITAVKLLERLPMFRLAPATRAAGDVGVEIPPEPELPPVAPAVPWAPAAYAAFFAVFAWCGWQLFGNGDAGTPALARFANTISVLAIPFLLSLFPLCAALRRIPVYEVFVEGAKEGFQVALRIIPFLVGMLVAIGMLRGSGAISAVTRALDPVLAKIGFPPELLSLVLMRPLSGSGSNAILMELVNQFGPDSFLARTAGTIMGSTETTFYVITVYFGAVAIRRTRHAIAAGLLADLGGVIAAVAICRMVFGG